MAETILTERLELRPWTLAEAPRLFDIRRRPEVARWLGDPEPWADLARAEQKIGEWASTPEIAVPSVWAIDARSGGTNTPIGPFGSVSSGLLEPNGRPTTEPELAALGFTTTAELSGEVEIGWYLHPDSLRKGYAKEAAEALLDYLLKAGVARVWALMWPDNEPSARVAAAIGMSPLGVVADPWYGTDHEPTSRVFVAQPRPAHRSDQIWPNVSSGAG